MVHAGIDQYIKNLFEIARRSRFDTFCQLHCVTQTLRLECFWNGSAIMSPGLEAKILGVLGKGELRKTFDEDSSPSVGSD